MKVKDKTLYKRKITFHKRNIKNVFEDDKLSPAKEKWGEKMIDKITESLTNKIRKEMPDVDDERAEVINYGLQILLGEIPKVFIMLGIAYILGVFKLTLITLLILLPYRGASGGFHLKTHIGCMVSTCTFYCGVAFLSKSLILMDNMKYLLILATLIFGILMIKWYAPADTEDVPIISKKIRKQKQILSYVTLIIGLIVALVVKSNVISNIIIFGYIVQTFMITRFAYKITNCKYGYEMYENA